MKKLKKKTRNIELNISFFNNGRDLKQEKKEIIKRRKLFQSRNGRLSYYYFFCLK